MGIKQNEQVKETNDVNQEEAMNTLTFKVEKMYRLPDAGGLKAFADVAINDMLVVRGVRILEGKKGMFVSMPQEQGKDNRWYDQLVCKTAGVYEDFARVVLGHYSAV